MRYEYIRDFSPPPRPPRPDGHGGDSDRGTYEVDAREKPTQEELDQFSHPRRGRPRVLPRTLQLEVVARYIDPRGRDASDPRTLTIIRGGKIVSPNRVLKNVEAWLSHHRFREDGSPFLLSRADAIREIMSEYLSVMESLAVHSRVAARYSEYRLVRTASGGWRMRRG